MATPTYDSCENEMGKEMHKALKEHGWEFVANISASKGLEDATGMIGLYADNELAVMWTERVNNFSEDGEYEFCVGSFNPNSPGINIPKETRAIYKRRIVE